MPSRPAVGEDGHKILRKVACGSVTHHGPSSCPDRSFAPGTASWRRSNRCPHSVRDRQRSRQNTPDAHRPESIPPATLGPSSRAGAMPVSVQSGWGGVIFRTLARETAERFRQRFPACASLNGGCWGLDRGVARRISRWAIGVFSESGQRQGRQPSWAASPGHPLSATRSRTHIYHGGLSWVPR